MPDVKDQLPPGQVEGEEGTEAVKVPQGVKTEEKVATVEEMESERQSTREWLRSLGMVAGEVTTREAPRMEREQVRETREREEPRQPRDTDEVLNLLREGDDARFVEGVVDLTKKRVREDINRTERDAAFGEQINKFVGINAPDVPLVVFWSFAQEAERRFPRETDKQIDWAINAGRAAMEHHNNQARERGTAIREVQEQSETLDGTPTRQRRRPSGGGAEKTTTFVEELLAARAKYE